MKETKKRTLLMLGAGIVAVISIAGCTNDIEPEKAPAPTIPGVATGSGSGSSGGSGVDPRGGSRNPNAGRRP